MGNKITTEIFIERSVLKHGNKYDYSKVVYTGKDDKVCIICPKHGEFWQTPHNHYKHGCDKCAHDELCLSRINKASAKFIKQANTVHNNKYSYDKTIYKGTKEKVIITCPIHGDFEQTPSSHLSGRGCQKCKNLKLSLDRRSNLEEFIKKANSIHKDKYNYDKSIYINAQTKICIICPEHGEFYQTPNHHLGGEGCPICKSSKGELLVKYILEKYNISFKQEVTFHVNDIVKNKKEFRIDFVIEINKVLYFIEYNGRQHYEPSKYFGGKLEFELLQKRDEYVRGFAHRNSSKVKLLELSYKLTPEKIEQKIVKFLNIAPISSNINSKESNIGESCDANPEITVETKESTASYSVETEPVNIE